MKGCDMARIHSHRHGKSHQTRPPSKTNPSWVTTTPDEARSTIIKLAKEGVTPSRIGQTLRDDYGVPLVKTLLGKSVGEVLSEGKAAPKLPQDLQDLIDRALRVQKHLQSHKSDRKNVHSLELVEAKIYRLSKYYKERGILPGDFKYTAVVAQLA
ncbi:MAG TPA: 30S ribosomal protein S15 [Nitrososphaerales archaeon]|nr:30S ribosomal protein S15 [Nitrososphaerales archaeon]